MTSFSGNYICRQNINIAMVDMVEPRKTEHDIGVCAQLVNNTSDLDLEPEFGNVNMNTDKFKWSSTQIGLLLGCFYWGYCASMIPGYTVCLFVC